MQWSQILLSASPVLRPHWSFFNKTIPSLLSTFSFSDQQVNFITFKLRNTLAKSIVLRGNLPSPYQSVVLKPGEIFTLNTTVPSPHPVLINVFDERTQQPAIINGKTFFIVYPTTRRVVKGMVRFWVHFLSHFRCRAMIAHPIKFNHPR